MWRIRAENQYHPKYSIHSSEMLSQLNVFPNHRTSHLHVPVWWVVTHTVIITLIHLNRFDVNLIYHQLLLTGLTEVVADKRFYKYNKKKLSES